MVVTLLPRLKANPPAAVDDDVDSAETEEDTLRLLSPGFGWLEMAFWSGNISNILLSLFLCNSLSPLSSLSPITCPVLLFLEAGVPIMSAGEAIDILPALTDFSVALL